MIYLGAILLVALPAHAQKRTPEREVTVFLVTEYAYLPGASGEHAEIGQSLCATRCNAFSSDYINYTEAGGWRMIKMATAEKIKVDPNNPFLDGQCLCTADRYKVVVNDVSYPDRNVLGERLDQGK